MNAKEARAQALKVNIDEATGQYAQAKLAIHEAVKEGKYKENGSSLPSTPRIISSPLSVLKYIS